MLPIEARVDATDQAIAVEKRQHVIAVTTLALGHKCLESIVETEQAAKTRTITQRVRVTEPTTFTVRYSSTRGGVAEREVRVAP